MQKLKLIIWREYVTRIRKKSFIIGTLLAPVGLLIYFFVIYGLTRYTGGGEIKVAVLDEAGVVKQLPDEKNVRFIPSGGKSLEQLKAEAQNKTINGVLRIPPLAGFKDEEHTVYYYSDDKLALDKRKAIERRIAAKIRDYKIDSLRLDRASLDALKTEVSIDPEKISEKGADESKYTVGVGLALGGIMSFIMFFMVLMYGQLVMRSVMEEKTNRIVEVMMSSVKPFELMLGKILGAGAVGLTQVVAWVILGGAVSFLAPLIMGIDPQQVQEMAQAGNQMQGINQEDAQIEGVRMMTELGRQNWASILGAFVIFFLGGYFIYSSIFAAIGSAMSDDMGEGQSLTLIATIPIILAFYITAFAGVRDPNSGLMVFASLFPLFSPIAMPFRMAFNPPAWQVALSLILVVGASFFFVWLAGRIYRVGILLYGKKVSLKELSKWMFYKG